MEPPSTLPAEEDSEVEATSNSPGPPLHPPDAPPTADDRSKTPIPLMGPPSSFLEKRASEEGVIDNPPDPQPRTPETSLPVEERDEPPASLGRSPSPSPGDREGPGKEFTSGPLDPRHTQPRPSTPTTVEADQPSSPSR